MERREPTQAELDAAAAVVAKLTEREVETLLDMAKKLRAKALEQ